MVVSLWRRGNRRRTAVHVQALRRGTTGILGHRLGGRDLLRHGLLGAAIGQRRHRGTGGAGRDRRLALLVTTAAGATGEALQQRQTGLLRVLLLELAAGLTKLGLGG